MRYDVAVIGAGIAGASIAAELGKNCKAVLLEQESQPGYHTTGRSAAIFAETYGPAPIRALTRASAGFYHRPPEGFVENPLLSPRGVLMVANRDQLALLETLIEDVSQNGRVERLNKKELAQMVPLLRGDAVEAGMYDVRGKDIDVNALHQGYLRQLKQSGGDLLLNQKIDALSRQDDHWQINAGDGLIKASTIVNAAGAWADEIGALVGAQKIGLAPKRRTIAIIPAPAGVDVDEWPLVCGVDEDYYLKPDAGRLLISPADETPSPPCDAQPEEIDIAICVDRIETAFDIKVTRIENKWAGLRSFVADKCPVVGFDANVDGFFWLAGQGGYGIQSAPALSRLAAAMVLGKPSPADIMEQGLELADISPERLSER